jgi:hypothetical protein
VNKKGSERKGPWHHAAVAALQGASIEEQLQYLDPDLVQQEELLQGLEGPGIGLGAVLAPGGAAGASAKAQAAMVDDAAANRAAAEVWGRWDVHARGRLVHR